MLIHLLLMAQLAAFPGAQGGGATSVGGRGGQVFEVTTLADGGTGSLRACVAASMPRTCVFRVAGCFTQKTDLNSGGSFLTVAGQTAPGEVILGCAGNSGFSLRIFGHDNTVRYVTISPDNFNTPAGPDTGTVGYGVENTDGYNNILDHVTLRWAGNKTWIEYSGYGCPCVRDSTLSWGLLYEPHEGHPVAISNSGNDNPTTSASMSNFDTHHMLIVNTDHRIPEYNNVTMRWINNIVFNYSWYSVEGLGGTKSDIVGNIWEYANLVPSQKYPIHAAMNWPGSLPGAPSFYVSGNIGHGHTTPNADQITDLTYQITGENGDEINGHFPSTWLRSSPLPPSNAFPIVPDDATKLSDILVPTVGNSQHVDCDGNWVSHRDPQDKRIINQWLSRGNGGFWPNGVTYTGQASFPQPLPNWTDTPVTGFPTCVASMHDGIPDQWKKARGLSTTDPNLHNAKAPSGYTWLEEYMNGSSTTVTPVPPVVVPPVTPPTASPDGTTVPPAALITDSKGITWVLGAPVSVASDPDCAPKSCGNVVVQNGTALNGTAATVLVYLNSTVYQGNASGLWWSWSGTGWVRAKGDPRPVTPPASTITAVNVSCTPQTVIFPSPSACSASVTGTGPFVNNVTWSANASNGVFTPLSGATSATVTATSAQDATKSGSATIAITQPVTPPTQPTFTITINISGTSFTVTCTATNGAYTCK